MAISDRRVRIGIVGCGDVAHRRYLPALAGMPDRVEVGGCCDPNAGAAERAANSARASSPDVEAHTDLAHMLEGGRIDAIINLTPAPVHGPTSRIALEAGVHVYSEKPIASSVAEADELIRLAQASGLFLLCAPAVAVSRRFRWLADVVASSRFGPLTLAVAQYADPGPAAWREYTGDPSVFYREGVGPVFDHGVYRLHELTMLMGPVRRVQAMGGTAEATRAVRAGPMAGRTIEVTTPDHVLINLEFARGGIGQLLASFGTPATMAPWLELHFTRGTISFGRGSQYDPNGPASVYVDDDGPLGLEGWVHDITPPPPPAATDVVEGGAVHFVSVLRGEEEPVLTAEHARHVLDVILKAYASVADGRSHETETAF